MHQLDLWPEIRPGPSHQLTASKLADADCEFRHFELRLEMQPLRLFELFGPVRSEAEREAGELLDQHGDRRRIRAEMGMEMLDTIPPSPSRENRRLEEIGDMQRKAAIRPPTDADGCAQRREKGAGTRNQEMKRATDEDKSARGDDEVRRPISRTSSGSTKDSDPGRSAYLTTSTPSRSRARISLRMKV